MAIFLFYGQEEYLLEKEIKKLKNELIDSAFLSMAYKVVNNPSPTELTDCIQTTPLMFGNTLSVIYIDKYLIGNKLNFDDKQIEAFEQALASLGNNVNLIFVCKISREENKKPDARKKLFKILSKYSQVREFVQFKSYQKELNGQILKMIKEKNLTSSSKCVALLIEKLGTNLTLIDSELEKLQVALHPSDEITEDAINSYCTSTDDVFILADLILQGNKNLVLKQFNLLTEKRHPLEIFSVLQNNFQKFIFIKNYEHKMNDTELARQLRLHEYIIMKTKEKLRKISLEKLVNIRKNLIDAEYKLKSGTVLSGETVLELALLS